MSVHDLHSRHADLVEKAQEAGYTPAAAAMIAAAVAPVDAVIGILPTGARTIRDDIADDLIELIETHVRRGQAIPELRLDMLPRDDWADADGRELTAWRKRREYRDSNGALVAAFEVETDDDLYGRRR